MKSIGGAVWGSGHSHHMKCYAAVENVEGATAYQGGFLYSQHSTDDNILEKGYLIAPCVCMYMCYVLAVETGALECSCAREERRLMNSSVASFSRRE